jgi:hypothetical protein
MTTVADTAVGGQDESDTHLAIQRARFQLCPVARNFFCVLRAELRCLGCDARTEIFEVLNPFFCSDLFVFFFFFVERD